MPTYSYNCDVCEIDFDAVNRITESDKKEKCPKCGKLECPRIFTPNGNFILKGSGWPSKAMSINKQMTTANNENKYKQQQYKSMVPTLVPNVDGERVDTWKDAQKLAKEKGHDTSSYEPAVQKEQSKKIVT